MTTSSAVDISKYRRDRTWSDASIDKIKQLVAPYLLTKTTVYVDRNHAADMITLHAAAKTIACRVRRGGYVAKYGDEFTLRYHRATGSETEFSKVLKGWGDWMFYGHIDGDEIVRWFLLDLSVWRREMGRDAAMETGPGCSAIEWGVTKNRNDGGTTSFAWFKIASFPGELVIASG